MGRVLIDTNILVYAHQPAENAKYSRALDAIAMLVDSRQGRVSAQILGEFMSATTRGRNPILSMDDARAQVTRLADAMPVLDVTRLIVLDAARGVSEHQLSYYDAQIWATARLNQVSTIFTEDVPERQRLEGISFVNPLLPRFDLEPWI